MTPNTTLTQNQKRSRDNIESNRRSTRIKQSSSEWGVWVWSVKACGTRTTKCADSCIKNPKKNIFFFQNEQYERGV